MGTVSRIGNRQIHEISIDHIANVRFGNEFYHVLVPATGTQPSYPLFLEGNSTLGHTLHLHRYDCETGRLDTHEIRRPYWMDPEGGRGITRITLSLTEVEELGYETLEEITAIPGLNQI